MTHTAQTQNGLRDLFLERLTRKVETYIEALDALPVPTTIGDIEKSARALIVLARLVNAVLPAPKPVRAKPPVPAPLFEDEDEVEDAPEVVLNRQQRRRAEAMLRKTGPQDSPSPIQRG